MFVFLSLLFSKVRAQTFGMISRLIVHTQPSSLLAASKLSVFRNPWANRSMKAYIMYSSGRMQDKWRPESTQIEVHDLTSSKCDVPYLHHKNSYIKNTPRPVAKAPSLREIWHDS
jgi:hypothetical protein